MERCCTLLGTQALSWVRMTYRIVPHPYQTGECPKVNAPRAGTVTELWRMSPALSLCRQEKELHT